MPSMNASTLRPENTPSRWTIPAKQGPGKTLPPPGLATLEDSEQISVVKNRQTPLSKELIAQKMLESRQPSKGGSEHLATFADGAVSVAPVKDHASEPNSLSFPTSRR